MPALKAPTPSSLCIRACLLQAKNGIASLAHLILSQSKVPPGHLDYLVLAPDMLQSDPLCVQQVSVVAMEDLGLEGGVNEVLVERIEDALAKVDGEAGSTGSVLGGEIGLQKLGGWLDN